MDEEEENFFLNRKPSHKESTLKKENEDVMEVIDEEKEEVLECDFVEKHPPTASATSSTVAEGSPPVSHASAPGALGENEKTDSSPTFSSPHFPATPLSTPIPPNDQVSPEVFDAIKNVVYHLLNVLLHHFRKELCEGCRINHRNQRQHECLQPELQDNFFQENFGQTVKHLLMPRFIPSVQGVLQERNILPDDATISAATQILLHNLRVKSRVTQPVDDIYGDGVKTEQLLKASKGWCYSLVLTRPGCRQDTANLVAKGLFN